MPRTPPCRSTRRSCGSARPAQLEAYEALSTRPCPGDVVVDDCPGTLHDGGSALVTSPVVTELRARPPRAGWCRQPRCRVAHHTNADHEDSGVSLRFSFSLQPPMAEGSSERKPRVWRCQGVLARCSRDRDLTESGDLSATITWSVTDYVDPGTEARIRIAHPAKVDETPVDRVLMPADAFDLRLIGEEGDHLFTLAVV